MLEEDLDRWILGGPAVLLLEAFTASTLMKVQGIFSPAEPLREWQCIQHWVLTTGSGRIQNIHIGAVLSSEQHKSPHGTCTQGPHSNLNNQYLPQVLQEGLLLLN